MSEYLTEFKLTLLAVLGIGISMTTLNIFLQTCILVVSLITALIALYKTIKHKVK